jgi:Gamma-glutamyl cyclotransferase, AIG2-like
MLDSDLIRGDGDAVSVARHPRGYGTPIFSYGSNNLSQLSARIGIVDGSIDSFPAKLDGYTRIFRGYSAGWQGGVASIHPNTNESSHVLGSIVYMTDDQISRLDEFEGGYTRRDVSVTLTDTGEIIAAVAYIADSYRFDRRPSEAYLMAIHATLSEQFAAVPSIAVDRVDEHTGECIRLDEWIKPIIPTTIEALCVMINLARSQKTKWVMPRTIADITSRLAYVGITSITALKDALALDLDLELDTGVEMGRDDNNPASGVSRYGRTLNRQLCQPLDMETLRIIYDILFPAKIAYGR